jgi:hypothetical protein
MSGEKSGCLGWFMTLFGRFMALFGIKPRHYVAEGQPAAEAQHASSNVTPTSQVEQAASSLELVQQGPPPTAEIESFPYKVQHGLLMPSEMVFYRGLASVVGTRALICPKVRLGDVFFVVNFKENRQQYFRIAEKHVDFLLCNPHTTKPILGIELDDEGHQQHDRKDRDRFIKRVFEAAELPLIHIPVQPRYNIHELETRLAPYLGGEAKSSDIPRP